MQQIEQTPMILLRGQPRRRTRIPDATLPRQTKRPTKSKQQHDEENRRRDPKQAKLPLSRHPPSPTRNGSTAFVFMCLQVQPR